MNPLVAVTTKRDAVRYIEPHFWIFSVRFDVVSMEVASAGVATLLTSKAVARKHRRAPCLVLRRSSSVAVTLVFSVSPRVVAAAALGPLARYS